MTCKITESSNYPSTTKATTKLCPQVSYKFLQGCQLNHALGSLCQCPIHSRSNGITALMVIFLGCHSF